MKPFSIHQLAQSLPGLSMLNIDSQMVAKRVVIDSRQVQPGDLFFAIRGKQQDGHQYINQALQAGAIAVVVDNPAQIRPQTPALIVDDTTIALGNLARSYRQQFDTLTIGVTGSVGKTTTRNLIHAVLSQQYSGVKSQQNYNNQWGVPLTLFDLESDHEFAVVEMGASQTGDIKYLSELVQPEIGVITAIGPAHLESFGSLTNIITTKCELFQTLPPTGLAVFSEDDVQAAKIRQHLRSRVLTAGWSPENELVGQYHAGRSGNSYLTVAGETLPLPFAGRHLAQLALYAVAIGREIGMHLDDIAQGLLSYQHEGHRQQVFHTDSGTIIDDCYNASPLSMQAACQLMQEWPTQGAKYLVLGSMLELGEASATLHQELGYYAAQLGIQYLYAFGPLAQEVLNGAIKGGMSGGQLGHFDNLDTLGSLLSCILNPEDVVLIKGSRSMQMERLVDALVKPQQVQPRQLNKRVA